MYNINGKSALTAVQIQDRKTRGFHQLEIHLFEDQSFAKKDVEYYIYLFNTFQITPTVIHLPISTKYSAESFHIKGYPNKIVDILRFTQILSTLYQRRMLMVIHLESDMENLISFRLLDGMRETFTDWSRRYPGIDFLFENLTILSKEKKGVKVRGSFQDSASALAEHMNEKTGSNRFGMVLDTCHMISTKEILNRLGEPFDMEKTIRQLRPHIRLLHLSGSRNFGFEKGHGILFETEEEIEMFRSILDIVSASEGHPLITLETNETNPDKAESMEKMLNLLEKEWIIKMRYEDDYGIIEI